MAVLLQFNVSTSWTVAQLQENTQIKADFLSQVLQILLKAKLLTTPPTANDTDEQELEKNSVISLYTSYKK